MNKTNHSENAMRVQCCVCGMERTTTGWRLTPRDTSARVSHTYCPRCYKIAMAQIDAYFNPELSSLACT